jgi:hypothetical protein
MRPLSIGAPPRGRAHRSNLPLYPRAYPRAAVLVRGGLSVAAGLVLAACASAGGVTQAANDDGPRDFTVRVRDEARTHEAVIDLPVERVWAAVPLAFADLKYTAGPSKRRGERLYLTPHLTIRGRLYPHALNSAYIDCGYTGAGTPASDSYSVTFAILMWVKENPRGGTKVEVLIDGSALQRETTSNAVPCQGTGRLERDLVHALKARLAAGMS